MKSPIIMVKLATENCFKDLFSDYSFMQCTVGNFFDPNSTHNRDENNDKEIPVVFGNICGHLERSNRRCVNREVSLTMFPDLREKTKCIVCIS